MIDLKSGEPVRQDVAADRSRGQLPESTLTRIFGGKGDPKMSTVRRLANALGYDLVLQKKSKEQ